VEFNRWRVAKPEALLAQRRNITERFVITQLPSVVTFPLAKARLPMSQASDRLPVLRPRQNKGFGRAGRRDVGVSSLQGKICDLARYGRAKRGFPGMFSVVSSPMPERSEKPGGEDTCPDGLVTACEQEGESEVLHCRMQ
jgi:hypothetical protein